MSAVSTTALVALCGVGDRLRLEVTGSGKQQTRSFRSAAEAAARQVARVV